MAAQLLEVCGGGGTVCCIGVARVGGACAIAAAGIASSTQESNMVGFIRMQQERIDGAEVPEKTCRHARP
jgi:hypothetical protein